MTSDLGLSIHLLWRCLQKLRPSPWRPCCRTLKQWRRVCVSALTRAPLWVSHPLTSEQKTHLSNCPTCSSSGVKQHIWRQPRLAHTHTHTGPERPPAAEQAPPPGAGSHLRQGRSQKRKSHSISIPNVHRPTFRPISFQDFRRSQQKGEKERA